VFAEQGGVVVLAAGGDELLEVGREVEEEVADARVVAVAEDGFALEVLLVVTQFLYDVGELDVELILLGGLGGMEASIQRFFGYFLAAFERHKMIMPNLVARG